MDPLSATASIIAILQITSDVVKYIITAKGATKERRCLREDILACESVLLQLQDHVDDADEGSIWQEKIKALEGPNTPLDRLRVVFEVIKTKLEDKKGLDKALSVLKWPFDEKEIETFTRVIQRELSILQLSLTITCRDLILAVEKSSIENGRLLAELTQMMRSRSTDFESSVIELYKHKISLERQEIINWLTPIDFAAQQSDFINRRQAGTGQWLLDSPEFQTWLNTEKQTLLCSGIPGAGKTTLTSIVVEDLCSRFRNDGTIGIAYIYCNYQRQDEQKVEDLVASLLRQLVEGQSLLPDSVRSLYDHHKKKRTRPSFREVNTVLQSVADMYSRLFIVVDALDECQTSFGCRMRFLEEIFGLQAKYKANIFATSRTFSDITEKYKESISLEIRASEEDIQKYISHHLMYLPSFVRRDPALQEEIKSEIIRAVDGMFLLVHLHLNSLIGKRSPKAIRAALAKLPSGSEAYNQTYEAAMERIGKQVVDQEELARQVLYWVICAKRPLTISEARFALAVELGERDLDLDNLPHIEDMISACCGLVTIDENSGFIRLVHYTAQEYFERTQRQWFPTAETNIAMTCLTYLSFRSFESGFCQTDDEFEKRLQSNPLYDYAAHNWGHHVRASSTGTGRLVLDFLQNKSRVSASSQVMMAAKDYHYRGYSQDVPKQLTGVHLAACFGLKDTIAALLEIGNEPDCKDSYGRTPLSYASERGFEAIVLLLLAQDHVNPDSKDSIQSWTPLWYAVAGEQIAIVALLLEIEAINPDSKSKSGWTPLFWAVERGHEALIKLLLEKDKVDPNSRDPEHGWTPLSFAAVKGHDGIVQLLLDRGRANPNPKDYQYGRSPLSWAAELGHAAVVKVLLMNDGVDLNSRSKYGRTALWFARFRGHEAIVKLLLEKREIIDLDSEESIYEQMPLWYAAERGQEARVKLMLEDGADPNSKSEYGRTPLSYAAERGHEEIVKLLLRVNGVDPESKDSEYERTPLSWAAANGHIAVVKLLLNDQAVNPDSKSKYGRTPLSWAAGFGHETVVKLLLTDSRVDPDSSSNRGRTPLSHAAERGHKAIVNLLLENDMVDPVSKDSKGLQTPLSWAARNGHHTIVKLLSDSIRTKGYK